jgi:hypothetical protein
MKVAPKPAATPAAKKAAPLSAAQKKLAGKATAAVSAAIAEKKPDHPLLEKFGKELGVGLGVVVTEALAVSQSWNAPLKDANGKPVQSVPGATRIGDHDLRKRHQEVVGPQINALVAKMKPGAIHDLLEGLAKGATEAPGDSYRLEAAVSDFFNKK